jgi:E3 ubiquitin-protein ligase TRIP12
LVELCPYLFSYETRLAYFKCASFGIIRALKSLRTETGAERGEMSLPRHKVRIDRTKILKSAIRVMDICLEEGSKLILQVEYFGEPGVGLGPTKEFFTLISKEIQLKELDMWLSSSEDNTNPYVLSPAGLFFKPLQLTKNPDKVVVYCEFLGNLVGKALLDERLLDIPFSIPFFKLLLGENVTLNDLAVIKSELIYVYELQKISRKKSKIQSSNLSDEEKKLQISNLLYRGGTIDAMDLTFVAPTSNYNLKENGNDILVTMDNLSEYISLINDMFLGSGIEKQLEAFKCGFNQFLPIEKLKVFYPDELDVLLCGVPENISNWTFNEIMESAKFGEGYCASSKPVIYLINTLVSFSVEERRKFLHFLTGSPRLPVGGIRSLRPKLTITRKRNLGNPDCYLPSVNTCFLFLKLPEYSSEQITREKLLLAMDGGSAFDFD